MFCLRVDTDPEWANEAIKDLDVVLVDHAHCEMKAATNALSLIVRYASADVVLIEALTKIAREELEHFERVVTFLKSRGLALGAPPVDEYAAQLRKAMNRLPDVEELPLVVDRLLVGALIEARSCERFKLLLQSLSATRSGADDDLRAFYEELFAAEARHYREYVDLAITAARPAKMEHLIEGRLDRLAEEEARIVKELAKRDASTRQSVHG
jgi:tRNA 2-(methylsulfanyl)-N6-isopentenyladenosine37 hydroxylase